MPSLKSISLAAVFGGAAFTVAQQNKISGSQLQNDPKGAALGAAPAWHMDSKTCMPTDGTDQKGNMNGGNAPDHCNELKINHNCGDQPKQNGPNTYPTPFPTYYVVRHCDGDNSWRIVYDVYFSKDTGHRHDWEWAAIKLVDDGTNTDNWIRDGIWMEQDGKVPYKKWNDIDSTYFNADDIDQDGQKGKDHAKLYFGKFHHPVFDTPQTKWFPNTCPPNSEHDYRSNDYRFAASGYLTDGNVINPSWNYGDADSYPPSFGPGGKHDVCNLS